MLRDRGMEINGYVTDYFEEKLYSLIEEECNDFYIDADIDDEELSSELNDKLTEACNNLMKVMNEIMEWQLSNNSNMYASLTHD